MDVKPQPVKIRSTVPEVPAPVHPVSSLSSKDGIADTGMVMFTIYKQRHVRFFTLALNN